MSQGHRHIIKKQRYKVNMRDREKAAAVQEQLSLMNESTILPLIEKVFDQVYPGDGVLRIDELKLDLGSIHPDVFEAELTERLESALHTELETRAKEAVELMMVPGGEMSESSLALELLQTFFETGALPWWKDQGVRESVANLFATQYEQVPQLTSQLIQTATATENGAQRVVNTLSAAQRLAVLKAIQPEVFSLQEEFTTIIKTLNKTTRITPAFEWPSLAQWIDEPYILAAMLHVERVPLTKAWARWWVRWQAANWSVTEVDLIETLQLAADAMDDVPQAESAYIALIELLDEVEIRPIDRLKETSTEATPANEIPKGLQKRMERFVKGNSNFKFSTEGAEVVDDNASTPTASEESWAETVRRQKYQEQAASKAQQKAEADEGSKNNLKSEEPQQGSADSDYTVEGAMETYHQLPDYHFEDAVRGTSDAHENEQEGSSAEALDEQTINAANDAITEPAKQAADEVTSKEGQTEVNSNSEEAKASPEEESLDALAAFDDPNSVPDEFEIDTTINPVSYEFSIGSRYEEAEEEGFESDDVASSSNEVSNSEEVSNAEEEGAILNEAPAKKEEEIDSEETVQVDKPTSQRLTEPSHQNSSTQEEQQATDATAKVDDESDALDHTLTSEITAAGEDSAAEANTAQREDAAENLPSDDADSFSTDASSVSSTKAEDEPVTGQSDLKKEEELRPEQAEGNQQQAETPEEPEFPVSKSSKKALEENPDRKARKSKIGGPLRGDHVFVPPTPVPPSYVHPLRAHYKAEDSAYTWKHPEHVREAYIDNSGLVLFWVYLPMMFKYQGLLDENEQFVDETAQQKAVLILHYLATGTLEGVEEFDLTLGKLLSGLPLETVVPTDIEFTAEELEHADNLVLGAIANWPALKSTGPDEFRNAFVKRQGKISKEDHGWTVRVEYKTHDILINYLPWGISLIKLPWMENMISVEWKTQS